MEELQSKVDEERQWWEGRRKGIQEGFMKELGGAERGSKSPPLKSPLTKNGSDDDTVVIEAGGSQGANGGSMRKKNKK